MICARHFIADLPSSNVLNFNSLNCLSLQPLGVKEKSHVNYYQLESKLTHGYDLPMLQCYIGHYGGCPCSRGVRMCVSSATCLPQPFQQHTGEIPLSAMSQCCGTLSQPPRTSLSRWGQLESFFPKNRQTGSRASKMAQEKEAFLHHVAQLPRVAGS